VVKTMTHVQKNHVIKCHVYHFPVITIFMAAVNHLNHQKWDGLPTRSCSADYRPRLKKRIEKGGFLLQRCISSFTSCFFISKIYKYGFGKCGWPKNNMITMITSKILGRPMDPMAYFQSHITLIFLHHPLQQGAIPQL
jgi:hypothetical protein